MNPASEFSNVCRSVLVTSQSSPLEPAINELIDKIEAQHPGIKDATRRFHSDDIFDRDLDKRAFDQFVRHLVHAQLVIIDLHQEAVANYILGIRQALSRDITLAVAADGAAQTFANSRFTKPPFTILKISDPDWIDTALEMTEGLGDPRRKAWTNDIHASGAYAAKPAEDQFSKSGLHPQSWSLQTEAGAFRKPEIVIWQKDIRDAKGFDVWVNSENTFMEMARFWDKSISAIIRKRGSVRIPPFAEYRRKDSLGLLLAEKMGTRTKVGIGKVFLTPTDPASLLASAPDSEARGNGVNYVAHLAAVEPNEHAYGFKSGGQIAACVENVLIEIHNERLNQTRKNSKNGDNRLSSVLFPLIGSGDGGAHPSLVAHQIINSLAEIIRGNETRFGLGGLTQIGIIAYQPSHLDYLVDELRSHNFQPASNEG